MYLSVELLVKLMPLCHTLSRKTLKNINVIPLPHLVYLNVPRKKVNTKPFLHNQDYIKKILLTFL